MEKWGRWAPLDHPDLKAQPGRLDPLVKSVLRGLMGSQVPKALTVLSVLPEAADLDVRILATDIDPNMVAQGYDGVYSEEALEPAPATLWRKYFNRADRGNWVAGPQLKRLVTFRELNLIGDWPMKGRFDVIFCRNVVIYFDDPTQERIWSRFTPLMNPGATLYIGHSERVSGPASRQLQTAGLTTYRLGAA